LLLDAPDPPALLPEELREGRFVQVAGAYAADLRGLSA